MTILVTGGAGFIGSHVTDALVADGHDVHVIDDFSAGKRENLNPRATLHELDIRTDDAASLFATHRYEALVHLAAQMDVRRSVADPRFDADINIGGILNLMEAGRRNGLRKVVFSSTGGAIYGEPDYAPQDEDHPMRPLSPYGITKLTTEKYLYFYEHAYDIAFVSLRYGNVYGPRQNPHGEAGVVAIFIQRLSSGKPATIFGDGGQTRDYVYVGDVVRANTAALAYDGSGTFNVGTSTETSVNELYSVLRDRIEPSAAADNAPARTGEQMRSVLDYRLAQSKLGWTPHVDIRDGLNRTVDWFAEIREASA